MFPYRVFPEHIGFIQIHGLFQAIGILIAILLLARYVKKRFPEKLDDMYGVALYVVIGSVAGSRLAYVIGNWNLYSQNIGQVFNLLGGGLSYFGGFVGAVVLAYVYAKRKNLNFWWFADLFAPFIPLGHAIGRIGDYLIGEHLGTPSNLPWAIDLAGELRHPVILYDMLYNLGIFFVLIKLRNKAKLKQGSLIFVYMMLYGGFRFLTGFIRLDEKLVGALSFIQYFALAIFIISSYWLYKNNKKKNENIVTYKQ